jgi:drug/metabolite transporter (DMT)-like permease
MRQAFLELPEHKQGIIAIVAAAILWSTGGLFIKLLPQDAFTILFYRSSLAAFLFGLLYRSKVLNMNRLAWFNSFVYCALLVCFVVSTKLTTAANSIFLQYTAPVYVLLAEPILFKIKMQRINVLTIALCLLGMSILLSGDLSVGNWTGNGIALFSGILLAALILGQRYNAPEYQVRSIFWGNIFVALAGFPAFAKSGIPLPSEAAMLFFLGVFQIGLGYLLFTYGLLRVLAIESALLAMLEPILNPVWVFIGYGEKPTSAAIVGGLLIIAALTGRILLLEQQKRNKQAVT